MAYLRAAAAFAALICFFLLGAPLCWAAKRFHCGRAAQTAPILLCRTLCFLLGVKATERGAPATLGPSIVVANHTSWIDVIALGAQRSLCFLAKREIESWPIFGSIARVQGCVFIDRERRMSIPRANRQIVDRLACGDAVVLFAEATTSDGTRVKKFHSSHLGAARDYLLEHSNVETVAVRPVSIAYRTRRGLPLGRAGRAAAAWYGDMDFLSSLWDLLRGGPIDCEIVYAAPIAFARGEDRKVATRRAEATVRSLVCASLTGRATDESIPGAVLPDAVLISAEKA